VNARLVKGLLAGASLLAISVIAVVDARRTSPGPISAAHAQVEELAGGTNCAACHGGWFSSLTDACLDCHEEIERQIDARQGLHGALEEVRGQGCGTCHSDHHGAAAPLVHAQTFALAGFPEREAFDHARIGFDMNGAHLALDCAECHAHADEKVLALGTRRFGGLDSSCVSCHEDPHEGEMALACASCHGQSAWDELHSVGHEQWLPLVGGHAEVGCRDCHAELDTHSLEALGARSGRSEPRNCESCHANPHGATFSSQAAQAFGRSVATGCVECHAAQHTEFGAAAGTLSVEQHAWSGFELRDAHVGPECAACHAGAQDAYAARYPGRTQQQCSSCHADVHGGQFAAGPFAAGDCGQCHDERAFAPHLFTRELHERTAFALDDRHAPAGCDDCHVRASESEARLFRGTDPSCAACHLDAHDGFFAPGPGQSSVDCGLCHVSAHFSDLPAGIFEHGAHTRFDVLGAHAQSRCESCHPLAGEPDAAGRRFGRVAEGAAPFEACASCHLDPHAGAFDRAPLPAEVEGRVGCARCHDESSFRALPHGFDHGAWTGFALRDGHAEVGCAGCHAPWPRADATGRTWGVAHGARCDDCHVDPHRGQFEVGGVSACARCHDPRAHGYLAFDHETQARFALGSAHADLDCAACHPGSSLAGTEFVKYAPLPVDCIDCHGVPEELMLRRSTRRR
jgi:hypothetical protein